MTRFAHSFVFSLAVLLLASLGAIAASADYAGDEAGMRAMQAEIAAERDYLRAQADAMEDQVAEGRTVFVYLPLEGFDAWQTVTMEDALASMTIEYLQSIARTGTPFSSDGLAAHIKARRDAAQDIARHFADTAAAFRARADRLNTEWRRLEAQIAELTTPSAPPPPPPTAPATGKTTKPGSTKARHCVELVETHPTDKPLSMAAGVSPQAAVHSVTDSGVRKSNRLDISLSWTAPPLRLCAGDGFDIEMTARNGGPQFEDNGINYIAKIGLSSSRVTLVSCSNPATWMDKDSDTAAVLVPTNPAYVNTCTFRVNDIVASEEPRTFLQVSLATIGERGAGEVLYRYATR